MHEFIVVWLSIVIHCVGYVEHILIIKSKYNRLTYIARIADTIIFHIQWKHYFWLNYLAIPFVDTFFDSILIVNATFLQM